MQEPWITRGFDGFRLGSFGNGGQNLYVSAAGILQRIHHMDLDGDGRADWLICNSQNHWERPPCSVYREPLSDQEPVALPSDGSISGTVADLNGDGYADLVLAMDYNGSRSDLNAFIYYGGPEGLGEHSRLEIPVPRARAVACGDFNGDGRPTWPSFRGRLRVFYQSELGFEPGALRDLEGDRRACRRRPRWRRARRPVCPGEGGRATSTGAGRGWMRTDARWCSLRPMLVATGRRPTGSRRPRPCSHSIRGRRW